MALAALASVATSPPHWRLVAPVPNAPAGQGEALLFSVEASVQPQVHATQGERDRSLQPLAAWAGRGEYYVPPGWRVSRIEIESACTSGSSCSSKCDAPRGAFLHVGPPHVVGAWSLVASSAKYTADAAELMGGRRYEVIVEATAPPRVEAVALPVIPDNEVLVSGGESAEPSPEGRARYRYLVSWFWVDQGVGAPVPQNFRVRATLDGFCRPGEAAPGQCKPPDGSSVTIVSVRQQ